MAKQLKLRRGTTSQHGSFTGAEGEVTVDTTKDTLVVHDGSTAGGHPLVKENAEVTSTGIASNVVDEDNLKISNSPTNGQFLQAQSGNTGGLTWATPTSYTHPNHSGEVTSSADGAQTIASNVVDEDNLKISNSGSNGQFLSKQSGNTGGLTWADVDLTPYAPKASPALTGTATAVNLTLSGNLTVNGTTTTVTSTNTKISDNLLELNSGASSNANDSGILIERGSTGNNAIIAWDESADKFVVGTTTDTASSTGNLTISTGTLLANVEGNGSGLTNLNATNITSGEIDRPRLGSGTANSSTVLKGNGQWGAPDTITVATTNGNNAYYIPFASSWSTAAEGTQLWGDSNNNLTYNPYTNTLSATNFSGSGANLTNLPAANLTGSINASNLGTGTVPIARLGSSGTASSSTVLRGDGSWGAPTRVQTTNTQTNQTFYLPFVEAWGTSTFYGDSGNSLTYNPSTNVLTSGTFSGSGASLTSLNASNLGSGTIPDARFPSTLPAVSGANLTGIEAGSTIQGTASGTLTANCAVMVKSDGTLEQPSEVTAATYTGGQIHSSSYFGPENGARLMYDPDNSRVIAVWTKGYDGNSSTQYKPFYSVGTISGSSISWGSVSDFSSASWTRTNSGFMHACYHPTTQKVVVIFQSAGTGHPSGSTQGRLYYVVGSISGSSISWGSSAAFADTNTNLYWGSNSHYASFEYDSFNDKLIFAYSDSNYYNKHSVCTVSTTANSATWGSVATVATRVSNYQKQSFNLTPLGDGRVMLTYVERDLHGYGYYPGRLTVLNWNASVGYYNYGSDIVPYGGTGDRRFASCKCGFHKSDDGTYTIFLGRRNSSNNYYYMQVGTLSGSGTSTSISWGSEHQVDTSIDWVYDIDYNSKSNKLITLYVENGNALKRREGTYSGTSITWDSVVSESIGSSQNSLNRAWHAPTQYKQMSSGGNPLGYYIIGWRNSNSTYTPSYWWARQMASTTRDATRYIGMAKQTYTNGQTATVNVIGNSTTGSSLTPNTTYYVDDDGTITSTATDTEIGKAYSSTKILLKK